MTTSACSAEPKSTDSAQPNSKSLTLAAGVSVTYPDSARQANTQGLVVIKITVSENGTVEKTENVSGDPILEAAAVDAVKQWRFQPFIEDGKPIKVSTKLQLRFAIADGKCTDGVKQASVTTPFEHPVVLAQEEIQRFICMKVGAAPSRMVELARMRGDVVMAARVGKDGTMQELHILSSASPLLNQPAIDAVKQWRYRPYVVSGEPVEVDTTIKVTFR